MMMSFAEAIEFINPAYNPNVDSSFPQPVLNSNAPIADSSITCSNEVSMTVAPERYSGSNTTNQPHAVELCKNKDVEALRCEVCSVSCNSISVLEKHVMGKKTGEHNPKALVLDSMKPDECMESVEISGVKNIDEDAIRGAAVEEMSTKTHISSGTQTMTEPLRKCSAVISKIDMPKHQGFNTSVADNTSNIKDMDNDEIMADKMQSTQLKPDNSVDLSNLDSASGSSGLVCKVCNIFSNSQAELEKHLAGKIHARKVKHLSTLMMPSPVTGCPKIQESIHSESDDVIPSENGTVILSPMVCKVCNIECNSQETSQAHVSGRKHTFKACMLGSSLLTLSAKVQGATERASKRGKIMQFWYCDVCKIHCNSSEILDGHIMGKKHMKQLKKLGNHQENS